MTLQRVERPARSWSSELVTVAGRARETYYEGVGRYVVVMSLAYGGQREAAAHRHLDELNRRFARLVMRPTLQSWMAYLHGETLLGASRRLKDDLASSAKRIRAECLPESATRRAG